MGTLNAILRAGVAIAHGITRPLQGTITHYSWYGNDEYGGKAQYFIYRDGLLLIGPINSEGFGISRPAVIEHRQQLRQVSPGKFVMTFAKLTILEPITGNSAPGRLGPIDERDRIVLPDGTTGPIIDIQGVIDAELTQNQSYAYEVWLGALEGNKF